jgi:hypothetical protein
MQRASNAIRERERERERERQREREAGASNCVYTVSIFKQTETASF